MTEMTSKLENFMQLMNTQTYNTHLMEGLLDDYGDIDMDLEEQKANNCKLSERLDNVAETLAKITSEMEHKQIVNEQRLWSLEQDMVGQKRRGDDLQNDSDRRFKSLFARTDLIQKKIEEFFPYSSDNKRKTGPFQASGALQSRLKQDTLIDAAKKQRHVDLLSMSLPDQAQERKDAIEYVLKRKHYCRKTGKYGPFMFKDTRDIPMVKRYHVFNSSPAHYYRFYKSFPTYECAIRYRDEILLILGLKFVIENEKYFLEVA